MKFATPTPPYLGPAKFHGGAQTLKPLKRIVIHGTVSKCVPGGARAIASYFRKTVTRASSAHYIIDPHEVVQVVGDHQVAYHAPPNMNSVGIEHCDPVAGPSARWNDANHRAMLALSAKTVASLCLAFDLPIRKVSPLQLRLGFRGICGHADVSAAWKQTNHSDPGEGFPWDHYMSLVKAEAKKMKGGLAPPPVVKPVPPLPAKRVVQLHLVTANIKNLPDLTREQVRADTFAVHKLGSVVMWQEIAEQDDRDDLEHSCPLERYEHVGLTTENPITLLKRKWAVRRSGTVQLHGGMKAVSPARYISWAEVAHHNDDALPSLVIMNTHYVSGAFSHAAKTAADDWRMTAWDKAHRVQTDLVAKFLAEGLTVLGGGDFNRAGTWEGFAPNHRWLMHGGPDHLWCAEAAKGVKVTLDSTGTLGIDHLYTDHAARWALVTFTKG